MNNFGHRMINGFHRGVMRLSGGRLGSTMLSMPVVELHTIGRTSGERRTVVLTTPVHGDGRFVLVASKGGGPQHPSWYVNLVAHPDVSVTVRNKTYPLRARTATPAERAELWPRIVEVNPGYAGYQQKTSREIPVVICEPRAEETR